MNLQRIPGYRALLLAALLCAGTAPALAQPDTSPAAPPRPREAVRGADLLTEAERADICARLRSATSAQERQAIMQRTHDLIATRASERGVTLRHGGSDNRRMGRTTALAAATAWTAVRAQRERPLRMACRRPGTPMVFAT